MTDSGTSDERFSALADDFVNRQRLGQNPSIDDFAAAYPDLADEIRLAFPALLMIADLKPGPRDATGNFESASVEVRGARLERLGDFRLLREAGRGGMGVVYEAEQESLGRRVALKVLAAHAIADPAQVKRFEREARAAAQLHHTNIVPVFGVGEQDGLHYYAMQFIAGLGLDSVIEEVKRFRHSISTPAAPSPPEFLEGADCAGPTAAGIAQSLVTEAFTPPAPVEDNQSTIEPARPGVIAPSPRADTESHSHSSRAALGASGISSGSGSHSRYSRSVARVGLQVAHALEYAHNQGILHRDIKPSNLLLDGQGTVWVADFGLAKAVEGEDLTHTGDIVGTIRYMAPERFHGQCDSRSDIYALGLTLYEMVGLSPAFAQTARQALIRQVMEEEPPRLRKLDPSIPRDLETVIHKAIARDPAGRYPTAGALALDLSLYLDDKPVHARDIGMLERSWKWARRRPAFASLLGGLVVALLAGFTAVTWQWRAALAARDDARRNLTLANDAVDKYFTQVSEEHLLDEPGMQPLRERLLKLALPYYQEFASRGSDDPARRVALARAYLNWGAVFGEVDSRDDAKAILRTAVDHFETLWRADPTNIDVQIGLAKAYQFLAQQSLSGDHLGEGFDEAKRAAAVWTKVVEARPTDLEARRMLGRCYNLAASLCFNGDPAAARPLFHKAVAILADAVRDFPADASTARQLGRAYSNLGEYFRNEADPEGAERALGQSLVISRKLRDARPSSTMLQNDLARTLLNLGQTHLHSTGALRAAGIVLEEARLVVDKVVEMNPEVSDYHYISSNISTYLAHVRSEQGQTAIAKKLLANAISEERELLVRNPSMVQNNLTLIESQCYFSAVERESGRIDAARMAFGKSLTDMKRYLDAYPYADNSRLYFQVLLESTCLERRTRGDSAALAAPLVQALLEREDSLKKRPADNVIRCQAVSGYLAIAQLFASSGATEDALTNLETAATLLTAGLVLVPDHYRLRCLESRLETARGIALDRCGKVREALAAANHAVVVAAKLVDDDPSYSYDLASALALKTRLSPREAGPPIAAVAALRNAVQLGFDNVFKLKNDEHLTSIRAREDFQTLADELANKAAASARGGDDRNH